MHDIEKTATVELVFALGEITRHALLDCSEDKFKVELSDFANHLFAMY